MKDETNYLIPPDEYTNDYYLNHVRRYYYKDIWAVLRYRDIISLIEPKDNDKILDLGCGIGTVSIEARKFNIISVALDYSFDALKSLETLEKSIFDSLEIKKIAGSCSKMPFKNDTFNKIISADMIEHISDEEFLCLLDESSRILEPRGKLYLYTPIPPLGEIKWYFKLLRLIGLLFKNNEINKLIKLTHIPYNFPINCKKESKEFEHFHDGIKKPDRIINLIRKSGKFSINNVKITKSSSQFQKLPYPFNYYWGGHISVIAEKK